MNGPVPMTFFSYQWMSCFILAALYRKFHGEARFVASDADGYFSLKTTVVLSGASILSTAAYAPARGERTPCGGKMIFWYVARASSDVNAVPSWNLMSDRSFTV